MRRPLPDPASASFHMTWNARGKYWILTYSWQDGARHLRRWVKIDSSNPMDELGADLVADAIRREVLAWLF